MAGLHLRPCSRRSFCVRTTPCEACLCCQEQGTSEAGGREWRTPPAAGRARARAAIFPRRRKGSSSAGGEPSLSLSLRTSLASQTFGAFGGPVQGKPRQVKVSERTAIPSVASPEAAVRGAERCGEGWMWRWWCVRAVAAKCRVPYPVALGPHPTQLSTSRPLSHAPEKRRRRQEAKQEGWILLAQGLVEQQTIALGQPHLPPHCTPLPHGRRPLLKRHFRQSKVPAAITCFSK